MNDYDALRDYLKKQKLPEFVLSLRLHRDAIGGWQERAVQADEVRVEPRSVNLVAPAKAGAHTA